MSVASTFLFGAGEDLFRKKAENGNKYFKMTSLFRKNGIFRNKYYYSFEKVAEKLEFN